MRSIHKKVGEAGNKPRLLLGLHVFSVKWCSTQPTLLSSIQATDRPLKALNIHHLHFSHTILGEKKYQGEALLYLEQNRESVR